MPAQQIAGVVTQKSNGTITIQPADGSAFVKSPAMGDEVAVTIDVTRTVAEIEQAAAEHKARAIPGVIESTVGGVPIGEGVQVAAGSPPVNRRKA